MEIWGLKTAVLKAKCDLVDEIEQSFSNSSMFAAQIREGDVLVITSKVVALSQGRVVKLSDIVPSKKARGMKRSRYGVMKEDPRVTELVLREADRVFPGNMLLTLKDGMLIPEAGIDLSNMQEGYAVLWPREPMKTAWNLWKKLRTKFKVQKLGIILSDSHCQPLRWGVTGLAIGFAGFKGVEDIRGTKDIYGKKLLVTRKAVADNLASSALVLMGEGDEKTPFVLIRGAPVQFTTKPQSKKEISIPPKQCIFAGIMNLS